MISITVDFRDVLRSLDGLPDDIVESGAEAIQKVVKNMAASARMNHRYRTRSGNLNRAIKVEETDEGAELYIDDAQADYGKYIHDGFKSWAPDQFIDEAVRSHESELETAVDRAASRAITKEGF